MRIGEAALRKTRSRRASASLEEQARGEQEARMLVAENMAIAGLGDEDLKKLPGSDSGNLAVARVAADHGRHAMAGRTFASAQRDTPASKSVATVGNHRRWPANSKSGWRSP